MSKIDSCNRLDAMSRAILEHCIRSVGHAAEIGELDKLNGIVEAIHEFHESVEKAQKQASNNIH